MCDDAVERECMVFYCGTGKEAVYRFLDDLGDESVICEDCASEVPDEKIEPLEVSA